jgi:hypothetical protein
MLNNTYYFLLFLISFVYLCIHKQTKHKTKEQNNKKIIIRITTNYICNP